MDCTKVTIVTVCYNAVAEIERTILSVINQTYRNVEYIIIDGGSTDGTVEIIKKYRAQIAYFVSEPDSGVYDAMNKAVKIATGEWINFMNAGDIFNSTTVLNDIFDINIPSAVKFLYSDFCVMGKKYNASFEKGYLLHQAVIYRKDSHYSYGFYDVTERYIISDYLFFMRFKKSEVMKVDVVIASNGIAGISGGNWSGYQKLCCDYIYNRISLVDMFQTIIYISIISSYDRLIKHVQKIKGKVCSFFLHVFHVK